MPSFILTAIDDDGTNTTKEFTSEGLKEVVEKTSDFLKGVGYVYDDLTYTVTNKQEDHISELVSYARNVASQTEV
tara:strand:+ start:1480 stop:1704 length:225 start_codon:yes stop_codon:yes gene_type:complete